MNGLIYFEKYYDVFREISRIVHASIEVEEVLELVVWKSAEMLGAEGAFLRIINMKTLEAPICLKKPRKRGRLRVRRYWRCPVEQIRYGNRSLSAGGSRQSRREHRTKRAGNLYARICDTDNIRLAFYKAARRKHDRAEIIDFKCDLKNAGPASSLQAIVDAGPMTTDKILCRCFLPDKKGCGADAGSRRPDGPVKVSASLF